MFQSTYYLVQIESIDSLYSQCGSIDDNIKEGPFRQHHMVDT
ncbi:hypothetical protein [Aminipila butyrica]|nr:hypothetical protein [Aminipila butyrica]